MVKTPLFQLDMIRYEKSDLKKISLISVSLRCYWSVHRSLDSHLEDPTISIGELEYPPHCLCGDFKKRFSQFNLKKKTDVT